jgi:nitronate monooxygenase
VTPDAFEPEDTVITTLFGPEWPGAPMRVLMNNAVRRALAPPAERSSAPSTIGETTVFGRQYAMPLNSSILPTVDTCGDFRRDVLRGRHRPEFREEN